MVVEKESKLSLLSIPYIIDQEKREMLEVNLGKNDISRTVTILVDSTYSSAGSIGEWRLGNIHAICVLFSTNTLNKSLWGLRHHKIPAKLIFRRPILNALQHL